MSIPWSRRVASPVSQPFFASAMVNNRGLRLSPTDIIKNFLLGNAARFGSESLTLARRRWGEVLKALDGVNSETFFRQFLSTKFQSRIRNSQVISNFKRLFMTRVVESSRLPNWHWYLEDDDLAEEADDDATEAVEDTADELSDEDEDEDADRVPFAEFLEHLVACARMYGQLVRGTTGHPQIDRHLRHLQLIKAIQTYGFLMHLRVGGCNDEDFVQTLRLTEAFLLRRHTCKQRANENEAAFARLCDIDCADPLPEVREVYREYSPSDAKFQEDFAAIEYSSSIMDRARYCLEQFEMHKQGSHLELLVGGPDLVHVEHVIPQKIKSRRAIEEYGDWPSYLGPNAEARHPKFVNRIGNLTLFAGPLNIAASNNPYGRKKTAYLNSALKLTNSLHAEFPDFRFAEVEARSAALAALAVTQWPIP